MPSTDILVLGCIALAILVSVGGRVVDECTVCDGGGVGSEQDANKSRSGVEYEAEFVMFVVAESNKMDFSISEFGDSSAYSLSILATTPATNGEAIDVPESGLSWNSLPVPAERRSYPGAMISTHGP